MLMNKFKPQYCENYYFYRPRALHLLKRDIVHAICIKETSCMILHKRGQWGISTLNNQKVFSDTTKYIQSQFMENSYIFSDPPP